MPAVNTTVPLLTFNDPATLSPPPVISSVALSDTSRSPAVMSAAADPPTASEPPAAISNVDEEPNGIAIASDPATLPPVSTVTVSVPVNVPRLSSRLTAIALVGAAPADQLLAAVQSPPAALVQRSPLSAAPISTAARAWIRPAPLEPVPATGMVDCTRIDVICAVDRVALACRISADTAAADGAAAEVPKNGEKFVPVLAVFVLVPSAPANCGSFGTMESGVPLAPYRMSPGPLEL